MEYPSPQKIKKRDIYNATILPDGMVQFEKYEYNNHEYINIRHWIKRHNEEYPSRVGIVFSINYLDDFINALRTVREKRNPKWTESIHIYHKDDDFVIEISKEPRNYMFKAVKEKLGNKPLIVKRFAKSKIESNNKFEPKSMIFIRKLEYRQGCYSQAKIAPVKNRLNASLPNRVEITIPNKRKIIKPLIHNLSTLIN